jgi:hypothetical protein
VGARGRVYLVEAVAGWAVVVEEEAGQVAQMVALGGVAAEGERRGGGWVGYAVAARKEERKAVEETALVEVVVGRPAGAAEGSRE